MSKLYDLHTSIFKEGLYVSRAKLGQLIREYNNFEMPISKRVEQLEKGDPEFMKFIKERIS